MKPKKSQLADKANDHLKLQEMQGCRSLKLKREALRLARYFLKKPKLNGDQFLKAVDVVEIFAGRRSLWLPLVENAYGRVKLRDKEKARQKMFLFCSMCRNREAVMRYLPKRITHRTGLLELLTSWQIWLENDRMDVLEKTVPIMSKAIQTASSSRTSAWLAAVYARYWLLRAKLLEDEELERLKQSLDKMDGETETGTQ